jgi:hypothetical protein
MRRVVLFLMSLAITGPALAQPCLGTAGKKFKFSNRAAPDAFVVEAFGPRCADAKVVIYIKTAEQGWHALHMGELAVFADRDVTPANLPAVLKDIAARIEAPANPRLETWDELQKAGTQPGGAPWRGTPLTKAEYERLRKAKPRAAIVPSDASRGMMYVWEEGGMLGRPVAYVFYGD